MDNYLPVRFVKEVFYSTYAILDCQVNGMNLILETLRNHGIKELYRKCKEEVQGYDEQFFNNLAVIGSSQLSFYALGGNNHIDGRSSTYNDIYITLILPVVFAVAMLRTSYSLHVIPEEGKLEKAKHYLKNITAGAICGAASVLSQQGVSYVSSFLTSSTVEQHDQAIGL